MRLLDCGEKQSSQKRQVGTIPQTRAQTPSSPTPKSPTP